MDSKLNPCEEHTVHAGPHSRFSCMAQIPWTWFLGHRPASCNLPGLLNVTGFGPSFSYFVIFQQCIVPLSLISLAKLSRDNFQASVLGDPSSVEPRRHDGWSSVPSISNEALLCEHLKLRSRLCRRASLVDRICFLTQ